MYTSGFVVHEPHLAFCPTLSNKSKLLPSPRRRMSIKVSECFYVDAPSTNCQSTFDLHIELRPAKRTALQVGSLLRHRAQQQHP